MNLKLLKLLNKNARLKDDELAVMTGSTEKDVQSSITEMEKEGIIRGYKAVVDWERVDNTHVSALIELKVTPKAGLGFEEVAMKVSKYPEVESVSLMSGGRHVRGEGAVDHRFRDLDHDALHLAPLQGAGCGADG